MSRSYKKTPYCGPKSKYHKRYAVRAERRKLKGVEELPRGRQYRKLYDSWDICDYRFLHDWNDFWKGTVSSYLHLKSLFPEIDYKEPDVEETYKKWFKWYRRK